MKRKEEEKGGERMMLGSCLTRQAELDCHGLPHRWKFFLTNINHVVAVEVTLRFFLRAILTELLHRTAL